MKKFLFGGIILVKMELGLQFSQKWIAFINTLIGMKNHFLFTK